MTNDRCINWPCAKDAGHEGPCGTSPDSRTSKELVARLRSVESRGERTIWTDAADEIERLQRERDELLDIIDGARIYVREFYPQSYEQQSDQDALLARIDAVLPPLPKFEACDNPACCLEKGHAGECDDGIPF